MMNIGDVVVASI